MKTMSLCLILSLGLVAVSCGLHERISSGKASVANSCQPDAKKPKLYKVDGAAPGSSTPVEQLVAGFFDQNCEEKKVYLNACSEQAAKAMLGLLVSDTLEMNNDEWSDFIQEGTGGYWQRPHLSCTSGATIVPQWEEGHKAEVHIISGQGGSSSLDIASRSAQGVTSRLHYVAMHSCLALRRQLGAESYADPRDPLVLTPLQLAPGDDALYLTCAKERPPQTSKEGWSLARTMNAGGLVYIARYRATANSAVSQELAIAKTNGTLVNDETDQKTLELNIRRRLGMDASATVSFDLLDIERDQILYDLCTQSDCSSFTPQHWRLVKGNIEESFDEKMRDLDLHILPNGLSVHTLQAGSDGKLTAFAQCPKESDLAGFLGFKHPEEPKDWRTRVKSAAEHYESLTYEEFPCLGSPSVCRIAIGDEDLSAKASSLYSGLSSYMRRPITGVCASASELEFTVAGKARVTGQPFRIGNLDKSVQKPFTSIRVIGGPQGSITLDRNCTDCRATNAPALVISGPGRFSLENLTFRSLDDPTAAPSIAIQTIGSAADKPQIAIKGLSILAGSSTGEFPFATGLSIQDSDVFLWSADVETYYLGVDAQRSRVSIFGVSGTDSWPLGTSLFKVVAPNAPPPFPGSELKQPYSVRALKLTDSDLSLYGTVLDGPYGLDMSGTKAQSIADAQGYYNRFLNSAGGLGTRSSVLYMKGYAKVALSWSEVRDLGGLIEFDAQNFTASTEGKFYSFRPDSSLKRKSKIIINRERGDSNFPADCITWDETDKVCRL